MSDAPEWKHMTDWSDLPDVYVTKVECQRGMFWRVEACSVPMAVGPECRLIRADLYDAQAAEITRLRAMVEVLTEALELADAALAGANMDMKHVWRKVKGALAEADTDDAPCTCCDDTGITHQTERFCSCEVGLASLATYQQKREGGE